MIKFSVTLSVFFLFLTCYSQQQPPKPYGPLPTKNQLDWHEMEYFSLICYGLNTYTEQEWAYGDVDPALFNPSDLDTDQWAKVASEAGMKGLILVAKHHDGFCLWPSKYTNYSVAATPWESGKGDVLGDLSKSCKKYGLKLGVYLSPWDRNHADYGKPAYVDFYNKQLKELMTEYGNIFEFWIDGANGGTGYYGGAKDSRSIDRVAYYGYDTIFSIVKENQPKAIIFSDVGPGSRWVGNESGIGSETHWNTITTAGKYPGVSDPRYAKQLGTGDPEGENWIPAEVNTTLSWPKAWYYHTGNQPRSLKNLTDLYYTSIGRGSPLNLGIAIAPSGKISEADKNALVKFKKQMDREFAENLVKNSRISASDVRQGDKNFSANKIIDEDLENYWASSDNIQKASLTIDFNKETTFNRLVLQEVIALGQRVHKFKIEINRNGEFVEVINGTTIGYKRVLRFDAVKTTKIRITLVTKAPCLTLSNIEIYNAPVLVADPVSSVDLQGNLSFKLAKDVAIYYAIGASPNPNDFKKYSHPIKLPLGGKIFSYAQDITSAYRTELMIEEYGIARDKWKVVSIDGLQLKDASKAIDNNPKSFVISPKKNKDQKHKIIINLGEKQKISGFSYLPRQDGKKDGIIFEYEFYVSGDGVKWKEPISEGTFSNIENNPIKRHIKFKNSVKGQFIKLVSKSTVRQTGSASFAEIEVFN